MRLRKLNGVRISFFCDPVDFRPARISKPDGSRHFIVGFSRSIIAGAPQNLVFSIFFHTDQMGMSAGYHKTQKWRLQIRIFNVIGRNVSLDMMHPYQRKIFGIGNRFCLCHTDQKSPNKSRTVSDPDGIDIVQCHVCLV